jgi:ribosome-binding protein aMBF1 (putative translation factor)
MDHQDFHAINIGSAANKNKIPVEKDIVKKASNDLSAHHRKIENTDDVLKIPKVSSALRTEIMQFRTNKKKTQKDIADEMRLQLKVYQDIENGKALYDVSTKKLINQIENKYKVKFLNK